MLWFSVALVALLLAALASPLFVSRVNKGRRARHAHRHGVVHWYPNYDIDLQFEPNHDRDVIAVSRADLTQLGYRPSDEHVRVPRTFRRHVPGDRTLSLWTAEDATLRPLWICSWRHRVDLPIARDDSNPTLRLDRAILAPGNETPSSTARIAHDVLPPRVVWDSDSAPLDQKGPRPADVETIDAEASGEHETVSVLNNRVS